ncbi:NAD-dependent epimerase/dehydratase [Macrophomina phaseolina MS6]|uniref:NAD-dependent epimerase/dehydratase n=1 Tax=Macrophomina phaseolina (strain MS6) TaxID=1126212 RepID=K2RHV4_MACPH|nr:NAD-dependent epimerase/dehydratase [Macrophomina phaseolina MS6]
MPGKRVFIVGPGFIGWNVLDLLVAEGYQVTGLVRRKEHAEGIERSGAKAILGDLHDESLIAEESAKSDIIFHTATADDLPSVVSVLEGLRQRATRGQSTIYIHTSGTSVLDDGANGAFLNEKVYDDREPADSDALPDDAFHRHVDLHIVRTAKQLGEKAKIAIMIPPEIYGYNSKHDRLTIQLPTIARFALVNGHAGYVGKGLSVESQIHVLDLARGYLVLLHAMEQRDPSWVLQNPYFFCENGKEFSWKEVGNHIADSLYKAGRIKEPLCREFSEHEFDQLFGPFTGASIGLNSRSRAARLRELGWEPKEKGIWQSWEQDELPAVLREWDARKGQKTSMYAVTVA